MSLFMTGCGLLGLPHVKTIYELKPAFQGLLRQLVRTLAAHEVTANQVTIAACVLSMATGALIAAIAATRPGVLLLLPVVLFARMALNAIDGMLAREHGMRSTRGGYLNELGDVVSDGALYLPLLVLPGVHAIWVALFVLLAVVAEMAGVIGAALGGSRRYDGPMGKSDRAFVMGAVGLAIGCGAPGGNWLNVLLVALSALLVITIANRVKQ